MQVEERETSRASSLNSSSSVAFRVVARVPIAFRFHPLGNVAVAEKLAHLEHEEWARSRKQPAKELAARALSLLDKTSSKAVEPGDELPKGYRPKRPVRKLRFRE